MCSFRSFIFLGATWQQTNAAFKVSEIPARHLLVAGKTNAESWDRGLHMRCPFPMKRLLVSICRNLENFLGTRRRTCAIKIIRSGRGSNIDKYNVVLENGRSRKTLIRWGGKFNAAVTFYYPITFGVIHRTPAPVIKEGEDFADDSIGQAGKVRS